MLKVFAGHMQINFQREYCTRVWQAFSFIFLSATFCPLFPMHECVCSVHNQCSQCSQCAVKRSASIAFYGTVAPCTSSSTFRCIRTTKVEDACKYNSIKLKKQQKKTNPEASTTLVLVGTCALCTTRFAQRHNEHNL